MAQIITVTGFKGGVGKSTAAVHLAAYLERQAPGEVVLVDGDPNRSCLSWARRGPGFAFDVVDEREGVRAVQGRTWVVMDTPARPDDSDLAAIARGSDLVVLPTTPDIVSVEPLIQTVRALNSSSYRVVLTVVPPRPSTDGDDMRDALTAQGLAVCDATIRRTAGFTRAALEGVTIDSVRDTRQRVAWMDFERLGAELAEAMQ